MPPVETPESEGNYSREDDRPVFYWFLEFFDNFSGVDDLGCK